MSDKKHYFLSASQVTFTVKEDGVPEEQQAPRFVSLNAIVRRDVSAVTLSVIGAANQAAQQVLFARVGEDAPKIVVRDVVQLNIQYLGEFTEEEFNDLPKAV